VPLTPADIHNVAFGKATLGKRGYDEEEVDTLLDEISMEMISLLEENADLQNRTGTRETADTGAAEAELHALTAELQRALQARERAAQRAGALSRELEQARATRAATAAAAPPPSDDAGTVRVLAMAQRTADQHLGDARRESEAVLAQAREQSGRVVGEAQAKADAIDHEAGRREAEARSELEERRTGALRDIREMTAFVADYQAALRDHMFRQQEHLGNAPRS
jgi:DivIVA domain-containing protein